MRGAALLLVGITLAWPLGAQTFTPPPMQRSAPRSTRIGLYGFSTHAGVDLSAGKQFVLGIGLDVGNLFVDRLRLRPTMEMGFLNGANTYTGNLELLFHFLDDDRPAIPYLGGGLGIAGHTACGTDPGCPALWVNAVLGAEVRIRSTFSWFVEYRGLDGFKHNRLCLGLTTRRGN